MIPISVTGQGFKSFAKKETFEFPAEAGFYFLTGDNQVEPELGANGAGKSTLWDLVSWILFGKTARGLKASDISTWYSDEKCGGEFVFEEEGISYKLIRTWKPNTLKLAEGDGDLRTVKQEDIDGILKLNYDSFLYSILFGQFKEMFFDLKATPKGELFSAILNLSQWDGYSKKAKTRHTELEAFTFDYKHFISESTGEIRGLEVLDFESQIEMFELSRAERKETLEQDLKDAEKDLEDIVEDGKTEVSRMEDSLKDYEELKEVIPEAREIFNEITSEINSYRRDISKKEGECISTEKDLTKFRNVSTDGVCPYCEQEVSSEHIQNEISKLEKVLQDRDHFVADTKDIIKELNKDLTHATKEIAAISEDYDAAKDVYLNSKNKVDSLRREATRFSRITKQLKTELKEIDKETNPHIARKKEVQDKIELLKGHIKQYNKELESTEQKAESVKYWIKGFKEVRLFLISEVLTQLEVEVNNCLFQLGLKDWHIEFATDSENKSGAIRKGFSVLIYSPYNEDPVSWESWSGGESQRLRLAGALGLANLILARNGVDSFIEIYDEPTQGLNDQGIQDLLETLNARSKELNKQIWIIDHRSLEFGGFNDSYVAVKTSEGTSIDKLEREQ